jgi:putative addiction module component (TIGR02574 family)
MEYPAIDIARLTVAERLALIERLWDSLRHEPSDIALNDEELAMIDARRSEHRSDTASAVEWETVRSELLSDQEADEERTRSTKRG